MAEGLGQAKEGIEGEITCPLCLGIYEDPKLLPCGHIYCKSPCLVGLARQANNTVITCPECRGVAQIQNGNVDAFPTAFHINRLKDIHKKFESTPKTCQTHRNQELAIYCQTCKQIICRDCVIACSDHQDHDYQYFDKAAEKHRTVLLEMVEQKKNLQELLSQAVVKVGETKLKISRQQVLLSKDIDTAIDSVVQRITEERQKLLSKLVTTTAQKLTKVHAQEQELTRAHSELSDSISAINESENLTDSEFVFKMNELSTQLEQIVQKAKQISLSPTCSADAHLYSPTPEALAIGYKQVFLSSGSQPYPSKCTFDKEEIRNVQVGREISVFVEVHDSLGVECVDEQNVLIEILYLRDLSMSTLSAIRLESGRYQVKFTPSTRGRHRIGIKVNGKHIMGSPMNMFVKIPPQELDGPVAMVSGLKRPAGLTFSKEEEALLVCELEGNRIAVIDKNFQKAGILIDCLRGPSELTTDSYSNIYVGTFGDSRVHKLDSKGQHCKVIGSHGNAPSQFVFPNGNRILNDKLFVCDTGNHCIKEFNKDLSLCRVIGKRGSALGKLNNPNDVDFDKNGDMYVTDQLNYRIQVFTSDGKHIRAFGSKGRSPGQLDCPVDLQIVDQYLFVTEAVNSRVSVFTTSGEFVTIFGNGYLSQPEGIAIDPDGFVYVTSHKKLIIVF